MTCNARDPYLFETPHGSVLHCTCRSRVQIAFDGLTLPVHRPCFEKLTPEARRAAEAVRGAKAGITDKGQGGEARRRA